MVIVGLFISAVFWIYCCVNWLATVNPELLKHISLLNNNYANASLCFLLGAVSLYLLIKDVKRFINRKP